jgi:hypothetical protein
VHCFLWLPAGRIFFILLVDFDIDTRHCRYFRLDVDHTLVASLLYDKRFVAEACDIAARQRDFLP